jgi:arylsulfatase
MQGGKTIMSDQPNILLLMTDQQRWDSLGCYGFEAAHTPNLDRLASDGALFERCYVNNPICTPSRASMFTGKHLPGHGVYQLQNCLPDDEYLFPRHLQDAGYQTALIGKLHVRGRQVERYSRHPNDGFDVYEWNSSGSVDLDNPMCAYGQWLREKDLDFWALRHEQGRMLLHIPHEYHATHWAAERTIDFIANRDPSRPFFAMMSIFDPHNPYEDWPEEIGELIDAERIPDPLVVEDEMEGMPRGVIQEHEHNYLGAFGSYSLEELRRIRFGYHASIALADMEMGRVLDTLSELGIADNTLVIFVSDHGDMLGDHGLLAKGAFFFDACTRVPLIMRWPERYSGGTRVDSLVQVHDIAATVLGAAGIDAESLADISPDAADLTPLATRECDRVRDWAGCIYRSSGVKHGGGYVDPPIDATMFMDERYKLSLYHESTEENSANKSQPNGTHPPNGTLVPKGTLYDMIDDPDETRNLWSDPQYRDIRLNLTERLLDWNVSLDNRYGRHGVDKPLPKTERVQKDPTRDR